MKQMAQPKQINEELHSRQIYAIGHDEMKMLSCSSCLISGMTGLGIEVAKCAILSGIGKVILHDNNFVFRAKDVGTNYYASNQMINKRMGRTILHKLQQLNSNINVNVTRTINYKMMRKFDVVIFCDWNMFDLINYNKYCRMHNIKFVMVNTYGLVGSVFCDFGKSHIVTDIDGEPIHHGNVMNMTHNIVTTTNPHKLHDNDVILFDDKQKYSVKTLSTHAFNINCADENLLCDMVGHSYMQVKRPTKFTFKSLIENIFNPRFDNFEINKQSIIHSFVRSLNQWKMGNNETYPKIISDIEYCRGVTDDAHHACELLFRTCDGHFSPVVSIIGAIGTQEIIKAITHKFAPNRQFMYYDCLDILPDNYVELDPNQFNKIGDMYDQERHIFGNDLVAKLNEMHVFIVGAGALGCEHLKNVAMMGIHNVVVTDVDRIEMSNLSRQFLFRTTDIGKSKSITAKQRILEMNPAMSIIATEDKIADINNNKYNSKFFENIDVVLTALDNIEGRIYIDNACTKYGKPMVDSGTLGTKGNVQTIIPFLTETYGEKKDPVDEHIPTCTLKMFPNKPEHNIQYALDIFERYFKQIPENCVRVRDCENEEQMSNIPPDTQEQILADCMIVRQNGISFKHCMYFALTEFNKIFGEQIVTITTQFPIDHVDEDGNKFWRDTKKFPTPIKFDSNNELHMAMIINFSHLWAECLGIPEKRRYAIHNIDKHISVIKELETKTQKTMDTKKSHSKVIDTIKLHYELFEHLNPLPFDRDNNLMMGFVANVVELRSHIYSIRQIDKMEVKRIAGKIIPALVTTTTLVSGLVGVELCKIAYSLLDRKYARLDRFRVGSCNIALQLFNFGEPVPPKTTQINETAYSAWTIDTVDNGTTLRTVVNKYKDVDTIYYDGTQIYDRIYNENDDNKLDTLLSDVVKPNDIFFVNIATDNFAIKCKLNPH